MSRKIIIALELDGDLRSSPEDALLDALGPGETPLQYGGVPVKTYEVVDEEDVLHPGYMGSPSSLEKVLDAFSLCLRNAAEAAPKHRYSVREHMRDEEKRQNANTVLANKLLAWLELMPERPKT